SFPLSLPQGLRCVLFGLFRYWYVVEKLEWGESPTDVLLHDWPLLVTVISWVGACMLLIK
ncbi:MAG: hypothetical protein EBZ49_07385, partial [Proteobacteria bacterium]|nr:hypothetical protein [Pseudomonadota bacterium]